MQNESYRLKNSGAQVLAAAVLDVFPGTLLVDGRATKPGFYYDFIFQFPFKEEFLVLIEEKMRKIVKEKREIKKLEMVPLSGSGYLKHKGQPLRAAVAERSDETLISLIQIGEHVDFQEFDFPEDTSFIGAFKLLQHEGVGAATRILGAAYATKEELKAALKQNMTFAPLDHKKLGEELKLFSPVDDQGHWMWLPKGETLRQMLLNLWKEECAKQNLQFISAPFPKPMPGTAQLCYIHGDSDGGEGMLNSRGYFIDQATGLKEPLQFILKLFKLCGIKKYRSVRGHFLIEDDLGREWPGPYVEKGVCSVFGPMERFVALMLEQNEGNIPFFLAPEQVRVIDLCGGSDDFICRLRTIGIRATVDTRDAQLKMRVREALLERIPYVVVIGAKELKTSSVAVRAYSAEEQTMPIDKLLDGLKLENQQRD